MGKAYLNRKEKTQVIALASIIAFLESRAEEWEQYKRNKLQIKYMKMARSFAQKALGIVYSTLDASEAEKLKVEVEKMQVVVAYKDDVVREYKRMAQIDSMTHMETDDFVNLASLAIASCNLCEDYFGDCEFKEIFLKYDIEPQNTNPKEGQCPYRRL